MANAFDPILGKYRAKDGGSTANVIVDGVLAKARNTDAALGGADVVHDRVLGKLRGSDSAIASITAGFLYNFEADALTTDASPYENDCTTTKLHTSYKFGNGLDISDDNNNLVVVPFDAGLELGSSDWTLSFWMSSHLARLTFPDDGNNGCLVTLSSSNGLFQVKSGGENLVSVSLTINNTPDPTTNPAGQFICIVRKGPRLLCYQGDGTLEAATLKKQYDGATTMQGISIPARTGSAASFTVDNTGGYNGVYLADLKLVVGKAIIPTAVPTAPATW